MDSQPTTLNNLLKAIFQSEASFQNVCFVSAVTQAMIVAISYTIKMPSEYSFILYGLIDVNLLVTVFLLFLHDKQSRKKQLSN